METIFCWEFSYYFPILSSALCYNCEIISKANDRMDDVIPGIGSGFASSHQMLPHPVFFLNNES